jgi:hypothetical protein
MGDLVWNIASQHVSQVESEKSKQSIEKEMTWMGQHFISPAPLLDNGVSGQARVNRNYIRTTNVTLQWKQVYGMVHNQHRITIVWSYSKTTSRSRSRSSSRRRRDYYSTNYIRKSTMKYTEELWLLLSYFFKQEINRERKQGLVMEGPLDSVWDNSRVISIVRIYNVPEQSNLLVIYLADDSQPSLKLYL